MTKQITSEQCQSVLNQLREECDADWQAAVNAASLQDDNRLTSSLYRDNRGEFSRRIEQLVVALTTPHHAVLDVLRSQHGGPVELEPSESGIPGVRVCVPVVDDVGSVSAFSSALVAALGDTVTALEAEGFVVTGFNKNPSKDDGDGLPDIFWDITASSVQLTASALEERGGADAAPAYWYQLADNDELSNSGPARDIEALLNRLGGLRA